MQSVSSVSDGFFSTVLHTAVSQLHSSVNIHAVLGGGWPRWQPLNIAGATFYWQDASWRVYWQVAMGTAAYSCNWVIAALVL